MYLDFFKLREFPFSNASDERFFFESEIHAEALSNMLYVIQQRKGMVLITGEVGAGKTFLGNMLASRLGVSAQVVTVRHPSGSAKQLLRAVAAGLGITVSPESDTLTLVGELEQGLVKLHRRNRLAAVVLDEVQDLLDETMEEIRLIWNWELDGQRLLQLVLIGQPELRDRLRDGRWESLRQRIVLSYHLGRLSPEDTQRYILHRLRIAAQEESPLRFAPDAMEGVYQATRGVPRLINTLCDNALLSAYAKSQHEITGRIVAGVVQNMTCWSLNAAPPAEPSAGAEEARPRHRARSTDVTRAGAATARSRAQAARERVAAGRQPQDPPGPLTGLAEASPDLLRAALQGEPSPEMARRVYAAAPRYSEAHHLALRILAQELVTSLRAGRR